MLLGLLRGLPGLAKHRTPKGLSLGSRNVAHALEAVELRERLRDARSTRESACRWTGSSSHRTADSGEQQVRRVRALGEERVDRSRPWIAQRLARDRIVRRVTLERRLTRGAVLLVERVRALRAQYVPRLLHIANALPYVQPRRLEERRHEVERNVRNIRERLYRADLLGLSRRRNRRRRRRYGSRFPAALDTPRVWSTRSFRLALRYAPWITGRCHSSTQKPPARPLPWSCRGYSLCPQRRFGDAVTCLAIRTHKRRSEFDSAISARALP